MNIDHSTAIFLNTFAQTPDVREAVVFFAQYFPYLVAALFLFFTLSRVLPQREKWTLLGEGLGSALLARFGFVPLIRAFVERPRPFVDNSAIVALFNEASYSFPSGHAAFFFALSTVVFLYNKRLGVWFYAASAVIGLARVAAGVHYPTDILGGAVLGVFAAYGTHLFFARYQDSIKTL